jgi:hypothetical protein
MHVAAVIAVVLRGVVCAFQIALALGVGKAAWGGQHEGALPTRLRVASGVAGVVVYPAVLRAVRPSSCSRVRASAST